MAKLEALLILCMVTYCVGSGGAAGGGYSDPTATVSSEVPEDVRVVTINKKVEFSCNATTNEVGIYHEIDWYFKENVLSSDLRVKVYPNGTVTINPVEESDLGKYECHYRKTTINAVNQKNFTLLTLGYKKLPKSGTAIEKEKFSLTCEVMGNPVPTIRWRKDNTTVDANMEDLRFNLSTKENFPPNAVLTIQGIERQDRGQYECCFSNYDGFEICTTTYIRVKDIYAALWPFLGIVAEVVILCLIIFIYEKKRTKNDCDESDTDQGNNMKEGPN